MKYSLDKRNDSSNESMKNIALKILIICAYSIASLCLKHHYSLLILAGVSFFYLIKERKFRVQLLCYLALFIMSLVGIGCLEIIKYIIPALKNSKPSQVIVPFVRMFIMVNVVLPLALNSSLAKFIAMMRSTKLPRVLYLPLTVTARYIPGFIHDIKQMRDCLKLRGYSNWQLINPRLWLLPVIFRSLHLTDELAVAAELKGVGIGKPAVNKTNSQCIKKSSLLIAVCMIFAIAPAGYVEHIMPAVPGMMSIKTDKISPEKNASKPDSQIQNPNESHSDDSA